MVLMVRNQQGLVLAVPGRLSIVPCHLRSYSCKSYICLLFVNSVVVFSVAH